MKLLFECFGCEVYQDGNSYFVKYDNGRAASRNEYLEITKNEVNRFSLNEDEAYKILLAAQNREVNIKDINNCS